MANLYLDYGADPVPVTGRYLSHNGLDYNHRAFLGRDLVAGTRLLIKPTTGQAALLVGTCRTAIYWALKREAERGAIESGAIPLFPAPLPKANGAILPASITGRLPDCDLIDFVRSVGVNRVLEAAVAVEAAQ